MNTKNQPKRKKIISLQFIFKPRQTSKIEYPSIGNSTRCITVHNSDAHLLTNITHCRAFAVMALLLLFGMLPSISYAQTTNWTWGRNTNDSKSISCGNTYNISCSNKKWNQSTFTYSITSTDDCPITVTLTNHDMGGRDGNVYLNVVGGSNSARWTKDSPVNTSTLTSTNNTVTIYFHNGGNSDTKRSFSLQIYQPCDCSGGGSSDCDGTETVVGDGSSTSYAYHGPVYNYWEYGYRQIIYDPEDDDICGGTISKIAFNYYDGTSFTRDPVTIYMGESPKEAFQSTSDWITDLSGFTTVYQGSLSFTTTGWQWINLQNTFNYSGQDNLVVIIKDDNGDYGSSYYFYTHTTTGNRQIYAYRDDYAYNTANPGTANDVTNYRPDTKFCIDCCTPSSLTLNYDANPSVSIIAGSAPYINPDLAGTGANNPNIEYSITPNNIPGVSINPSTGAVTTTAGVDQVFTIRAIIPKSGNTCAVKASYTLYVGDGCNRVGAGTEYNDGSTYNYGLGFLTLYDYVWTQIIYTAAELGSEACTINSIAFKTGQTDPDSEPQNTTIYMALTDKNEFEDESDFVSSNNMVQVYHVNSWSVQDGWNVFTLDTPFDYSDPNKNILIGIQCLEYDPDEYGWDYFYFTSTEPTYRMICAYSEETIPDPADMGSFNPSDQYSGKFRFYTRPNIKICMTCCNLNATIEFGD